MIAAEKKLQNRWTEKSFVPEIYLWVNSCITCPTGRWLAQRLKTKLYANRFLDGGQGGWFPSKVSSRRIVEELLFVEKGIVCVRVVGGGGGQGVEHKKIVPFAYTLHPVLDVEARWGEVSGRISEAVSSTPWWLWTKVEFLSRGEKLVGWRQTNGGFFVTKDVVDSRFPTFMQFIPMYVTAESTLRRPCTPIKE